MVTCIAHPHKLYANLDPRLLISSMMMMMMMMVLCPKAGSLVFTPPGDEMSEVASRCLPHRQLWVSNLCKVATQWHEVDSNPRPSGCKAQNIPLRHHVHHVQFLA